MTSENEKAIRELSESRIKGVDGLRGRGDRGRPINHDDFGLSSSMKSVHLLNPRFRQLPAGTTVSPGYSGKEYLYCFVSSAAADETKPSYIPLFVYN